MSKRWLVSPLLVAGAIALAHASHRPAIAAPAPSASVPTSAASIWVDPGDVPLPEWARSVEFVRDDEALAASPAGTRRGLIAAGVRLPLLGATRGPGCMARWLLVGPLAYVCADKVKLSAEAAGVDESIHPIPTDALPYKYYFVGKDGGDAFAKLSDVDDDTPVEQLERGWAVAGVGEVSYKGASYVKTRRGRLVARNQLGRVAADGFHGETIVSGKLEVSWILPDKTTVLAEPKGGAKAVGTRTRLELVNIADTKKVGKDTFLRIGEGEWIRGIDVRAPTLSAVPEGVGETERWIDVDISTQTLVAYEGPRPVYATVVSTGRIGTPTPKGTFRIWVKLRSATMSNADSLSSTEEGTPYSIEDVPWVQYFSNGVALHGAFWHRKFGTVHSHGCVNMSPVDAMHLFEWTLPRLPRGWDASFPTSAEPATLVRVR